MKLICESLDTCDVTKFYKLLGKKWAFPIFCRLKENTAYGFEDIIKLSFRHIHRTTLSNLLKDLIYFKLIEKKGRKYLLTEKGSTLRKKLLETSKIILHPKTCNLVE